MRRRCVFSRGCRLVGVASASSSMELTSDLYRLLASSSCRTQRISRIQMMIVRVCVSIYIYLYNADTYSVYIFLCQEEEYRAYNYPT